MSETVGAAPSPYLIEPGRGDRNRRRAHLLVAAALAPPALVVFVVVALTVALLPALGAAVVVWAAGAWLLWRQAPAMVLGRLGPERADPRSHARLFNLATSLCAGAGLARPELLVVEDPAPNSLALGSSARAACVVVTTGLLAKLSRMELEGVVAHELVHLRRNDAAVSAAAGACLLPLAAVAPGLADGLAPVLLGRREGAADLGAVGLTRYPPGLISALEKMRDDPTRVRSRGPALDHLWNLPAGPQRADRTDPEDAIDGRIGALLEL